MTFCYSKYGLTLSLLCVVASKSLNNFMDSVQQADSPVKVTAVFINCQTDDIQKKIDDEDNRFEREELYKHNALRNCDKKLALTIKLTSKSSNSADEYVPIDHVLDGHSKRRVRLLNPYVLRLRRDAPLEAYKLRFIETVNGLLATSTEQIQKHSNEEPERTRRETREDLNIMGDWRSESVVVEPTSHAYPARTSHLLRLAGGAAALFTGSNTSASQARVALKTNSGNKKVIMHLDPAFKRSKRHVKNVIIEEEKSLDTDREMTEYAPGSYFSKATNNNRKNHYNEIVDAERETGSTVLNDIETNGMCKPLPQYKSNDNVDNSEGEFALYEIEKPSIRFCVHVHLFEKLSTLAGNTLWNDITKGVPVSLSAESPEWSSSDINVHYKPADYVERGDFVLPESSLSLLIPLLEENSNVNSLGTNIRIDHANYILIPSEDVLDVGDTDKEKNTFKNVSSNEIKESRRKVILRITRALNGEMENNLNVVKQASGKFLTMRHRGIRHAQVDLEARADDNQLVHPSAPGRIALIVADNTRGNQSTLTAQVTNTGIFVARFRVEIRDCDSDVMNPSGEQESAEEVSLPPRHTRRLTLPMQPLPEAPGLKHCSGDDPRLPCREMSAARQDAAGLPSRRGARFARACQYADVTTINIVVVVVGVIGMLLFMGVLKGLLGLIWPRAGVWGLEWILEEPRQIDCYYERGLRARKVVYDDKGWPVHPDTRKRTVRVVSFAVEFILNVIFFVVIPGLVAVDTLKTMKDKQSEPCFEVPRKRSNENLQKLSEETSNKQCNMQCIKRLSHRRELPQRLWMTPEAEHLSTSVWEQNSMIELKNVKNVYNEHQRRELEPGPALESDSDQEDTAFVLMSMKKSSESLAKMYIKPDTADQPVDNTDHAPTHPAAGKDNLDQP